MLPRGPLRPGHLVPAQRTLRQPGPAAEAVQAPHGCLCLGSVMCQQLYLSTRAGNGHSRSKCYSIDAFYKEMVLVGACSGYSACEIFADLRSQQCCPPSGGLAGYQLVGGCSAAVEDRGPHAGTPHAALSLQTPTLGTADNITTCDIRYNFCVTFSIGFMCHTIHA